MKFIELHDDTNTFWVNTDTIEMLTKEKDRPQISSCVYSSNFWHFCKETPEEILQKIAEATQSERVEIFQKFVDAEQHERSFMDDWKREIDEQLSRPTVRKDGDADATDRC